MTSLRVIYFVVVIFRLSQATYVSKNYTAKPEFDNKKSNDELLGEYSTYLLCECSAMCQNDCDFYGYNSKLKKCRVHKKIFNSASGISDEARWRYYSRYFPMDCKEIRENGHTYSGVYEISPFGTSPLIVYCDMETMEGGWTAIQKRVNGSLSFDRNWSEYKNGFGSPEQDIWVGNDVIHQLTKENNSFLYVSITLQNGTRLYEMYDRFLVSDEIEKYQLFLAGPATGSLGDSMLNIPSRYRLSGMYFSTRDSDNDRYMTGGNCAAQSYYRGGWWFNWCHQAFLNDYGSLIGKESEKVLQFLLRRSEPSVIVKTVIFQPISRKLVGSSKGMEPDVPIPVTQDLEETGYPINVIHGNNDSTTTLYL
ncbi:fibrinogen beta chain-like [Saccostrea echinata]|uniref:fibrinogen beta chain-like n=1 Tax=Saccostrea echinata TaxID=191078 RepID=UPI002A814353|nr:fibrinogen beta chain-like [Saccostrea echinata]